MGWYQLAMAFQRKGNEAEALLATARKHFLLGQRQGHPRRPDLRQARPSQVRTRLARHG